MEKHDIAFCIIHSDKTDWRNDLVKNAKQILSKDFVELKVKTQHFESLDDAQEFVKDFELQFDPDGVDSFGWKPGEIGVWISHYLVWKSFKESRFDGLFVFEDDVIINDNFVSDVMKYIKELPDDFHFLSIMVPTNVFKKYKPDTHDFGQENVCKVYQRAYLTGYFISQAGAKRGINLNKNPIKVPIDAIVWEPSVMNSYALKPSSANICGHKETPSTIQNVYRKRFKKQKDEPIK